MQIDFATAIELPAVTIGATDADGWSTVSEQWLVNGELVEVQVGSYRVLETPIASTYGELRYEVKTVDMGLEGGLYAYHSQQAMQYMTTDADYVWKRQR